MMYTRNIKDQMAFGRIPAYCKYELFMERYRSVAEILRANHVLGPSTQYLDIGCGEGYMKYFFDKNEGIWYGVDCWKERIDVCKELGYQMFDLDINSTKLPWEDNKFDVVFACHVVEHLSNLEFAFTEMKRVLKPGGYIYIGVPTKPPIISHLVGLIHSMKTKELGETQHSFYSGSARKMFQSLLGEQYQLVDMRGLRIVSARRLCNLENNYYFYKLNTVLAKYLTYLSPEINIIFKKTS
ncbi:MAG: class I SAM-dependent methyltransferase [Legionellales bacterium]|nr:class I SAM-dependent methyltransferase [Legionellales bacterium]